MDPRLPATDDLSVSHAHRLSPTSARVAAKALAGLLSLEAVQESIPHVGSSGEVRHRGLTLRAGQERHERIDVREVAGPVTIQVAGREHIVHARRPGIRTPRRSGRPRPGRRRVSADRDGAAQIVAFQPIGGEPDRDLIRERRGRLVQGRRLRTRQQSQMVGRGWKNGFFISRLITM